MDMLMRKLTAIIIMGLLAINAMGQARLTGRVTEAETGEGVPFATVSVIREADSSVAAGAVSDLDGKFDIAVPQQEKYLVAASAMGYETVCRSVAGGEVGDIALKADATMLKAVEVTAKVPLIEQKIDKIVMNVSQSAFAQGNNAMELLRKAPGVSIDRDGNVQLNGQTVSVWIDGRPSHLDGKSLEALLEGTDGTSIDKIEIMANPSSKYDAEGQGGIINIKTKKNLAKGVNGTLSANYGGMYFERDGRKYMQDQDVNLNLGFRTEKTNSFVQLSESTGQMGADVTSDMEGEQMGGYKFKQHSESPNDIDMHNLMLKVGSDWFIDKKNTLGFIYTMPMNYMLQEADSSRNKSYQTLNEVLLQRDATDVSTAYKSRQYAGNLNYTHTFDEMKASELTVNLDYFHNVGKSANRNYNYIWTPIDSLTHPYLMDIRADRNVDIYSAKADWQGVVGGKYFMEAGGKWALSRTDNDMERMENGTAYNSLFKYDEDVTAAYVSFAGQLSAKWSIKAGLRGEYTYSHGKWISADTTSTKNYFDLFPTLFVGYNPTQKWRLSLSYTRRIQRPSYDQLNPFQNYIDAHTSNVGNPDLKPCYSDNAYLMAGYGQHLSLTAAFMYSHDVLFRTPELNVVTGDQTMRYSNAGNQVILGGGVTLSEQPLGKHFALTAVVTGYAFRSERPDGINNSFYGQTYLCLTYNLPKDWKLQLDGWGSTPVIAGYFRTNWNYSINFGVKKTCLDNRLTFSLNINDLFRTMDGGFDIVGQPGVTSTFQQKYLMQKVTVGLQWNFGTAQKPLKQRRVGDLEESSRTGSSGTSLGSGNQQQH